VIVLEEGSVVMQGDPESAIDCYDDLMRQRTEKRAAQLSNGAAIQPNLTVEHGSRMGTQEATISALKTYDKEGQATDCFNSGDGLTIEIEYKLTRPLSDLAITLGIYSETNVKCYETYIASFSATFGPLVERGRFSCYLPELPLLPGRYFIDIGLHPTDWSYVYDYHWQMHPLHIMNGDGVPLESSGVVPLRPIWSALSS
jgi:lipopolysaccharide transport system ATP-binding protein